MKQKLLIVFLYFFPLFFSAALVLLNFVDVHAQDQHLIDSLQNQVKKLKANQQHAGKNETTQNDTALANTLYQLSKIYWGEYDKSIDYAKQSLKLSEQIGYKNGIGFANYSMGVANVWRGNFESALQLTSNALKIGNEINDKRLVASAYVNLGATCNWQGRFPEALKNFYAALKIAEEINDTEILLWCYNNIASVYYSLNKYDESNKAYFDVLKIYKEKGDSAGIVGTYSSIGLNYTEQGKYDEAIKHQLFALKFWERKNDKAWLFSIYIRLGFAYQQQGNYPEALKYYDRFLKVCEENKDTMNMAGAFEMMGQTYLKQKKYNEAEAYLNKGLMIQKQYNMLESIRNDYQFLSDVYKAKSQLPEYTPMQKNEFATRALEHYKLYITYRDSIVNQENTKSMDNLKLQYETEKKEQQIKLLSKENETKALATEKEKQQKNFAFIGIGGLIVLGGYIFVLYSKRKKLSNQLSQSLTDLKSTQQQLIQIEREKEAENIRLRISRDIHDDIGHSLTKISLLSDMTAGDKQINSPEAIETLGRISDYSRNVNSSLSEIVWAISPKHDSLDSLIVYMRNHIHTFFENMGITYQINFPDAYENRAINPELKRNIFLVLKESLNNTLKYAKAKNVRVDFKIDGDKFELKIKDDGVGFTPLSFGEGPGVRTGGNGLPNMKHRIEQSGGSFEINSSPGSGCEIFIIGALL